MRRCSSEGLECASTDRACQETARERALEVVCDQPRDGTTVFVYCPSGATTRDSGVVWLLLVFACLVAVAGSVLFYFVLKRGRATSDKRAAPRGRPP
jgi:hypothetical protein